MGIFGKDFDSKSTSKVDGGANRETTRFKDGSSTDITSKGGKVIDITDHEKDGSSHSHHVGHGITGWFKGERK